MKEQWIEDISTKMDGYEMDAPELSWSEIESRVEANRHSRIVSLWQRRIAVAASLLMIVAASTTLLFNSEEQSPTNGTMARVEGKKALKVAQKISIGKKKNLQEISENPLEISKNAQEIFREVQEISNEALEETKEVQEVSKDTQEQPLAANSPKPTGKEKKKTSLDYPEDFSFVKQKRTARLMASLYYGNGVNMNSAMSSSSFDPNIQQDASMDYVASGDNCLLEQPEEEPYVSADHHQPIRVGLSVKYALGERWGIETGLAYSYLRSDISEEKRAYTINTKQKIGYLGIPLAASYKIVNAKPLNVYVLAGTMLEVPVKAKADEVMVSSGMETTRQERSLSKSALQLSFSGRLGAEYSLTPSLGIYVEPGVSYYLDNGSSIETAYSDKPFNFNLNLGIRLTFGR